MRFNRRIMWAVGFAAVAAASLGLSGHATAFEKLKLEDEETIELFPALPAGEEYVPYYPPAPNGLPGPTNATYKHSGSGSVVLPTGYAPADFDPSCCQVPVCEEVCPDECCECDKVPYILSFCNPVTGCKEYVEVCIPVCCQGCPQKSFRRAIIGYGVITFKWCNCDYEVKIRVRRSGKIVVREKD